MPSRTKVITTTTTSSSEGLETSRQENARRRLQQKLLQKRQSKKIETLSNKLFHQLNVDKNSSNDVKNSTHFSDAEMNEIQDGVKHFDIKSLPRSQVELKRLLKHALSKLNPKYVQKTIDILREKYGSHLGDRVESVWKDMELESKLKNKTPTPQQ